MSTPDYEVHLDRHRFNRLWDRDDADSETFPFGEDLGEIDKIIEEEIGPPRRRGRGKARGK